VLDVRLDVTEPAGPLPTLGVQHVLGDRSLPTLPVRPHLRVDAGRATPEAFDCPMFSRVDGIYPIYVGHIKTSVALAALVAGEA